MTAMIPQVVTRCCVCQNRIGMFVRNYSSSLPVAESKRMMPFEEYRKLKKTLKQRARIWGVPFAFAGMTISSAINVMMFPNIFDMAPEEIQPILGMDPLMFAALTSAAAAGVGFIAGGALHSEFWKLVNKEKHRQLTLREEDFLRRVQRHRFADFGGFQDDYYGDKVQTLSDYRQWVREQQRKKELHKDFVAKEAEETHP